MRPPVRADRRQPADARVADSLLNLLRVHRRSAMAVHRLLTRPARLRLRAIEIALMLVAVDEATESLSTREAVGPYSPTHSFRTAMRYNDDLDRYNDGIACEKR
jgi:hypothetical protein